MEQEQPQSKFLVPLAIVVAGALIAGAVYYGGKNPTLVSPTTTKTAVDTSKFEVLPVTSTDHILGSASASVVAIEYSDTECPFCKVFHNTMHQLMSNYSGDLAWVYRQFPIPSLHSKAPKEAEATECVAELGGNQAFWNYLDSIFATTNSNDSLDPAQLPILASASGIPAQEFSSCLSSGRYTQKIKDDMQKAYNAGGRGTPYTVLALKTPLSMKQSAALDKISITNGLNSDILNIFSDKKKVAVGGALPIDLMKQIIDVLLNK